MVAKRLAVGEVSAKPDSLLSPPEGTLSSSKCRLEENFSERRKAAPLAPFAKDLALRGLADSTQDTIIGAVRRYSQWAILNDIMPERSSRQDLLNYLGELRARDLRQPSLLKAFSSLSTWFAFLEELGLTKENPVPYIQKKYLKSYKDEVRSRRLISVEDAAKMVSSTIDTRDKAMLVLLLKTGIRRGEMISLEVEDVDLQNMSLLLRPTAKRSNRQIYFDEETTRTLSRWLRQREMRKKSTKALFLSDKGKRLQKNGVRKAIEKAAERAGLHDPNSKHLEDRFSPHCCRHWFTTHLMRSGMQREYVQWLRGDEIKEAVDIYFHVDPKDVKESYLAHIPKLGI